MFIFFSEALSGDQPPEPQPVITQQPVADGSQQPLAQPAGNQPPGYQPGQSGQPAPGYQPGQGGQPLPLPPGYQPGLGGQPGYQQPGILGDPSASLQSALAANLPSQEVS